MPNLAVQLSHTECRAAIKGNQSKKKSVPPPRYLCLSNYTTIDNIRSLDASHEILRRLRTVLQFHGNLNEENRMQLSAELPASSKHETTDKDDLTSSSQKYLIKRIRSEWLCNPIHAAFWLHVIIGVNQVLRKLSLVRASTISKPVNSECKIDCVLIDSGWLTTELGHHILNLCKSSGTRLLSVKPVSALADVITTRLKPIKKVIALGLCTSAKTPIDLLDLLTEIQNTIPLLVTDIVEPKPHLQIDNSASGCPTFCTNSNENKEEKTVVNTTKSWDSLMVDPNLYEFDSEFASITTCKLSEFYTKQISDMSSNEVTHSELECDFMTLENSIEYRSPTIHATKPQTEDERKSNVLEKRRKLSELSAKKKLKKISSKRSE